MRAIQKRLQNKHLNGDGNVTTSFVRINMAEIATEKFVEIYDTLSFREQSPQSRRDNYDKWRFITAEWRSLAR